MNDSSTEHAIAIIGMSASFPGGFDSKSIWPVLERGETTATRFRKGELDPSLSEDLVNSSNYVPVRGVLAGAEFFDAEYFGFSSREAEILDPQQRVFLQLAVHALEDAGYYRNTRELPIGVYAGLSNITYFRNHLARRPDVLARIGELNAMMGNEKDYLATRVAHKLDLTGPCLNLSTACSTSSVAIAQAFYALQTYQCDMALAGGISVTTPQNRGYVYQEGSILSPDGACRSFDARAQGTFFSNGGGIIVMKRLQEAIEDDDFIAAIIRGVGVNNDGAKRASFAAPGVEGQAEAIAQALAHAEVDARDIGLVEAHGTATPIGDPIEVEALKAAYGEYSSDRGYCAIGSIKSNLGHLDVAAGVAGVIKTVLSLQAAKIPPMANFQSPNPELRIEDTPFYINDRCIDWPADRWPRLAGVSSFGSGGTNAHLILQEAPQRKAKAGPEPSLNAVMLSAKSESALSRQIEQLREFSTNNTNMPLSDIAHTHRVGRRDEECRAAVVAESTGSLQLALDSIAAKPVFTHTGNAVKNIAFVFPGQGSQFPGMGKMLYAQNECFRTAMDNCFSIFDRHLDTPLKNVLFDEGNIDNAKINQTAFAQPALFTIGYALTKLYGSAGINPEAMIGHSIGEYLAAYFAGVFSLEDAIAVVATRGRLMQSMEPGAMLAILAGADEVEAKLTPGVQIAAYNSSRSTVVAGCLESIDALQAELDASKVMVKRIRTSHAFHSPMMEKAADQLASFLDDIRMNPPNIPFVSTVTGEWISDEEATTSRYWGDQIRKPVKFSQAAAFLIQQDQYSLVEIGPGTTATGFLRQHISDKSTHAAFPAMDTRHGNISEPEAYMNTLARLWEQGHNLIWEDIVVGDSGRRIPLPGYPFEEKRHWIEATSAEPIGQMVTEPSSPESTAINVPAGQVVEPDEGQSPLSFSLRALVADMIGIPSSDIDDLSDFVDMGFDSLLLTQLSIGLKREYSTDVPFRRLLEDLGTFSTLHDYIDEIMPENVRTRFAVAGTSGEVAEAQTTHQTNKTNKKGPEPGKSRGAAITRVRNDSLSTDQEEAIQRIIADYVQVTAGSKERTQDSRQVLSDPRSVSGFNPMWKEAVYPIFTNRSSGAYLWDVDDNRFVDFTCGFGPILLGHGPEFLKNAVIEQVQTGVETGPQTQLACDVAKLISDATGVERVAFASTGTEAVMAAVRIARTVTARSKILVFSESYHGIHDEVTINPRHLVDAAPGAPGIPQESLQNVLVASYGTDDAIRLIEENADELAAVLVEPVQSRNPTLQPREFLKTLREITEKHQIALIFDEIVTGFRVALGGAQTMFDIQADIVTYGKVIGGGYPLGVVAGKSAFLDALDGGFWEFGDQSVPEAGVTFFAGTFVRHPLMLAAAKATLKHLLDEGPVLQETLNSRTEMLCAKLVVINQRFEVDIRISRCSSFFVILFSNPVASAMFYLLMRSAKIFVWDGRVIFLNTAHSDEDLQNFIETYESAVGRLVADNLLEKNSNEIGATKQSEVLDASKPPLPGARLGRDPNGQPGWYIEDPEEPGKYRLVDILNSTD